jgi:hypothetical protein
MSGRTETGVRQPTRLDVIWHSAAYDRWMMAGKSPTPVQEKDFQGTRRIG